MSMKNPFQWKLCLIFGRICCYFCEYGNWTNSLFNVRYMLKYIISKEMSLQMCQQHSLDCWLEFIAWFLWGNFPSYMVQGHICILYIDLSNLKFRRIRKFKDHLFWGLFMEFCITYSKWYIYDIITSLFHENFDKPYLGIIDFLLVEIWVRLFLKKKTDVTMLTMWWLTSC